MGAPLYGHVVWLRSLGLGKEAIFRENDIDEAVLPSLTHENLKELDQRFEDARGPPDSAWASQRASWVVGDLIGSGASQEQAIVGETPNLAARLQGVAEPNSVVIAADTAGS